MVSHPNHQHPLTLVTDTVSLYPDHNGDWQCDNCNQSFNNQDHPYHCNICSFDLCEVNCYHSKKHSFNSSNEYFYSDMKKIYEAYGGNWKCDGCKELKHPENNQFGYHCFTDESDLCVQCFNGHDFPIHIHKLKPTDARSVYNDDNGYWVCDSCKRTGSEIGTHVSLHCLDCEFDACHDCIKEVQVASHSHPLSITDPRKIYQEYNGAWKCDVCDMNYEATDIFPRHCFTCGFDVCSRCLVNEICGDDTGPPSTAYKHNNLISPQKKQVHKPPVEDYG